MTNGQIVGYEIAGMAILILLGCGVVANAILAKNKGYGGGWLLINFGWGLGVFAGVYVAYKSGGHLNPAVSLGQLIVGNINFGQFLLYVIAQFIGAFIGAVLAWAAYKQHFDEEPDPAAKLGVFSTGPQIRNTTWNLVTEIIATFVLVFVLILAGQSQSGQAFGALVAALVVVGIGASLGGPTGYAINPARDLGPRIAHALLPIKGKGSSDWGYSWIPVVGPLVGGAIAALLSKAYV